MLRTSVLRVLIEQRKKWEENGRVLIKIIGSNVRFKAKGMTKKL